MEENNSDKPGCEDQRKQWHKIVFATLEEMKDNGTYTDVVIACGGKEFPVHKLILVASCSFFRVLFNNQFKESQTNYVEMPTIPASVMKIIIDIMYFKVDPSEISTMTLEIVIETLKASHLLGYELLSNECLFNIKNEISIENYKMIWDLFLLYENEKYPKDIVVFLHDNMHSVLSDDQVLDLSTDQMLKLLEVAKENENLIKDIVVKRLLEWTKKDASQRHTKFSELFGHINFNSLSRDYLSFLTKEEPLVYNDREILLKLVTFMLPKLNEEISASSPSKEVGIIACFLGFCKDSKGIIGCIQKVNLRQQTKEKYYSLPFPLTTEKHTIVRSDAFLYILVNKRTSYDLCKYDIVKNEGKFKGCFRSSFNPPNIISFIDHKNRICIGNIDGKENVYMYKENINKWVSFFKTPDCNWNICSSFTGNTTLYILFYMDYGVNNMRQFRMCKLKDNTTIQIGEGFLLSSLTKPNLVTSFDNKFYLFEFKNGFSRCIIGDPFSAEWKSVVLDFHLPGPLNDWNIFSRKDSILFFSYQKAFEYFPRTQETIDVCRETTHDLCRDIEGDLKMNATPGHVYMWLE